MKENNTSHLEEIVDFLKSIGITCQQETLDQDTFLPGISIRNGQIFYDESKLLSPGDLLHEAGHIAVLSRDDRDKVNESENVTGTVLDKGGCEMAAIAWSWAALTHLNIPPNVVFHEDGYKGQAESVIHGFQTGGNIGANLLQWLGMSNNQIYPKMEKWVLEDYPDYIKTTAEEHK